MHVSQQASVKYVRIAVALSLPCYYKCYGSCNYHMYSVLIKVIIVLVIVVVVTAMLSLLALKPMSTTLLVPAKSKCQ